MIKSGFGLLGLIVMIGFVAMLATGSFYFWSASFENTGPFTATSTSIIDVGINARNEALELKKKLESRYYGNSGADIPSSSTPTSSVLSGTSTANWKTYRNDKYGFEFKYPNYWTLRESLIFDSNPKYKLSVRYISKEQNSAPAPTYCMGNKGSSRCQSVKVYGDYTANIDWQSGDKNIAYIDIYSPDGGRVEIYVTDFITTDKAIVFQILTTFKFTK